MKIAGQCCRHFVDKRVLAGLRAKIVDRKGLGETVVNIVDRSLLGRSVDSGGQADLFTEARKDMAWLSADTGAPGIDVCG